MPLLRPFLCRTSSCRGTESQRAFRPIRAGDSPCPPTLPAVNPSFDLAGHSDKSAGMESRAAPTGRAEAVRAELGRADAAATRAPARRGPSTHAFARTDWALLAGVAAMWGS